MALSLISGGPLNIKKLLNLFNHCNERDHTEEHLLSILRIHRLDLPTDLCAPTATTEVAALRHWRANCRQDASSLPRPRRGGLMVRTLMAVMLGRHHEGRLHPSHVTVGLGPVTTRHRGAAGDPMFTPRGSAEDCAVPAPCVTLTGSVPPPPVSQLSHSGHRILEISSSRHLYSVPAAASSISTSPPVKG